MYSVYHRNQFCVLLIASFSPVPSLSSSSLEDSPDEDEEDEDTRAESHPARRESDPEPFPNAIHL
jgi:hypothetical protein